MHLDVSVVFKIQLRQRHVFIFLFVYHEKSFILGLVGDQLEAAEGNPRWAGIRDVWVKPQYKVEPRMPVNTQYDVMEPVSSLQTRIKNSGHSRQRPLSRRFYGCI